MRICEYSLIFHSIPSSSFLLFLCVVSRSTLPWRSVIALVIADLRELKPWVRTMKYGAHVMPVPLHVGDPGGLLTRLTQRRSYAQRGT